ncbi:MAG: membrane protein insertion efficiency factor YidD [Candidatus Brocadiales bacterium]
MRSLTIGIIRMYQRYISPLKQSSCRYFPSCSEYMIEAVEKKGVIVGVPRGIWRILRCHPLGGSGYNPVD